MKLLPLILGVAYLEQKADAHFSTSATDKFIYDDFGRVSIFHGANMVMKGFPWYPQYLEDKRHIAEMASWGFNTIRLGVMWTGVEPEMGVFNETYISIIDSILADFESFGINVIIDVHQDVMSTRFCLYDAFPTWLVDLSTSSQHDHPYPMQGDCYSRGWGANYLSEDTGAAFQDIYDNVNGMRDHFSNFWTKVASSFKNRKTLGYEIINEPWAGNIYQKPSLLLPGIAGRDNLQPLYDVISEAIRSVDKEHIILYEPVTWGMIFNGTVMGSGFTHVPGGAEHADKSIFSFHYYCWWFGNGGTYNKETCDRMFGPKVFETVDIDINNLGGAAMLTEWGQGCDPANGLVEECSAIMDIADEHLTSWAAWYFFPNMEVWYVEPEAIDVFSRTFAQRISGIPSKMKYDATTYNFELCYTPNFQISEPTEIYASFSLHYPDGVDVLLTGDSASSLTVQINPESNRILISNVQPKEFNTARVTSSVCAFVSPKK